MASFVSHTAGALAVVACFAFASAACGAVAENPDPVSEPSAATPAAPFTPIACISNAERISAESVKPDSG